MLTEGSYGIDVTKGDFCILVDFLLCSFRYSESLVTGFYSSCLSILLSLCDKLGSFYIYCSFLIFYKASLYFC